MQIINHTVNLLTQEQQFKLEVTLLNRNNVRLGRFVCAPMPMEFWMREKLHRPADVLRHMKRIYGDDPRFGQAYADEIARVILCFERMVQGEGFAGDGATA